MSTYFTLRGCFESNSVQVFRVLKALILFVIPTQFKQTFQWTITIYWPTSQALKFVHSYLVGINSGLAFIYFFTSLHCAFVKQRFLAIMQMVNLPLVTDK